VEVKILQFVSSRKKNLIYPKCGKIASYVYVCIFFCGAFTTQPSSSKTSADSPPRPSHTQLNFMATDVSGAYIQNPKRELPFFFKVKD